MYINTRYLLNIIFRNYHSHIHENTCSPINYQLKTFSTSKILGMIARERAKTTASVMAKSLIQVDISSNIYFLCIYIYISTGHGQAAAGVHDDGRALDGGADTLPGADQHLCWSYWI